MSDYDTQPYRKGAKRNLSHSFLANHQTTSMVLSFLSTASALMSRA